MSDQENYYLKNKDHLDTILDSDFVVIAGPCCLENEDKLLEVATKLYKMGIRFLRAGTFKMRTTVDSYQGLGLEGLKILARVAHQVGMFVVSEITSAEHLPDYEKLVDIYLVGMRNMFNYPLLEKLSYSSKPVILKRNLAAKVSELLGSLSYLTKNGKTNLILCERGIRTFEDSSRNTLDLTGITILKNNYPELKIYVDPSHASGQRCNIEDLSLASIMCGLDGLIIEVDKDPEQSLSDAKQIIDIDEFSLIYHNILKTRAFYQKMKNSSQASIKSRGLSK
ncbi:MAG: 3-deoxy-7-phosphoheptulonate synthase [Acholeplasmatales bacterium]|jgi:3-deoxy-7-phosphoheptulonate synthase|nr:3-deoxy-7-phosphoheptulonate synthase [Acholeplasmatales bacterium]